MFGPPGFYGKAVTYGDFLARGLPREFIAPWDRWLALGLDASRERLGAAWLEAYLTSPIWRFALGSGVCGAPSWAGVLMPSVDRVGRHFPLTIAAAGPATIPLARWIDGSVPWYAQLERLARSALDDGFDAAHLEDALAAMTSPVAPEVVPAAAAAGAARPLCVRLATLAAAGDAAGRGAAELGAAYDGCSFWWTHGSEDGAPLLLAARSLPDDRYFHLLLDGPAPSA